MKKRKVALDRATLFWVCGLFAAVQAFAAAAEAGRGQPERLPSARVAFVENRGQLPDRVAFSAPTFFGSVLVTRNGSLEYVLREDQPANSTLSETLVAGKPRPAGGPALSTVVSYFYGNDPRRWQRDLPTYEEVRLGEAWPGVSVSLRAHARNVEKIFTILPGARAEAIWLRVDGARPLQIASDGTLTAGTGNSQVRFAAPLAYQERDGVRHPIPVAYVLRGSTYGFRVGAYDRTLPLVVDPILQSTYLGGADADSINAIAIDPSSGDVFVAGHTFSTSFPGASMGAQRQNAGGVAGFVARFDPKLRTLLHATYLGGSGGEEILGIAVNPASGDVYVAGLTSSTDFPNAYRGAQPQNAGGGDGFVAWLDPTLTQLLGATYFGGGNADKIVGLAIHPGNGDVYVGGVTNSSDLPGTTGGAQAALGGDYDGFVARFDPTLATRRQTTYLGGSNTEYVHAFAIHFSSGEILIGGQTLSNDLPATEGGANTGQLGHQGNGNWDAFVARVDPALTRFLQATYLGGAGGDDVRGIAADPASGEILVTGWTNYIDFPGTEGGAQAVAGGEVEGFVARFNPTLTALLHATYVGGGGDDYVYGIAVDPSAGDVYVAGETWSTDLPGTSGGAQPESGGRSNGFVARLDGALDRFLQTTYLGGGDDDTPLAVAIHPVSGEVLVAGTTFSHDFPSTAHGAEPAFAGGSEFFGGDGFVTRVSPDLADASHECALHPDEPCLNGRNPNPILRSRSPRPVTRPSSSVTSTAEAPPF